jgi:CBS domain-containing protein
MSTKKIAKLLPLMQRAISRSYGITASYAQKGITPTFYGNTSVGDRQTTAMPSRPLPKKEDINEEMIDNMVTFRDLNVSDIVNQKSIKDVKTINETSSVYEAISKMTENGVGGLIVTTSSGQLAGVITERDYLTKVILKGLTSKDTQVSKIMTPRAKLVTVKSDASAATVMRIMTDKKIRHLPIVENNDKVIGVVSIGDVIKFILVSELLFF